MLLKFFALSTQVIARSDHWTTWLLLDCAEWAILLAGRLQPPLGAAHHPGNDDHDGYGCG